jgi:DNA mismatch endonuclease (patch repair protein)
MRAIKNKRTKIEELLGKALWAKGYRYRRNNKTVFGRPDFTFRKYKIVVFCDSEFFHGKDWEVSKHRIKTNTEFWQEKIEGNIRRDQLVNKTLRKDGWIVIRFWGEEIKKNLDLCIDKIELAIEERKQC